MPERFPDIEVIGEATSGEAALRTTRDLKPDVILMDISLPDGTGVEAARQILRDNREVLDRIADAHVLAESGTVIGNVVLEVSPDRGS